MDQLSQDSGDNRGHINMKKPNEIHLLDETAWRVPRGIAKTCRQGRQFSRCGAERVGVLKTLRTPWNDDSNKRVMELAASGSSAARASVALNRSISAVRMQASKLGRPFLTNLTIKKNRLAKCAAAERALMR
jgi:hypothetical protein